MTAAPRLLRDALARLERQGVAVRAIDTERKLYVALARSLGHDVPEGHLPERRKIAARAIRHYVRTGEFVLLPLQPGVEDRRARNRKLVKVRLMDCFEVGDVGASRPGLLATALENDRPTRITLLFEGQDGRCHYCSEAMLLSKEHREHPRFATLDHVHPKSKGGIRSAVNSVAACAECNFRKGSTPYEEFAGIGPEIRD